MAWFMIYLHSRLLSRLRPVGLFNTELLGVLRVQPLPAAELHGLGAHHASNRITRQEPLKDVEANVPARGAPRDKAAIDVVPQRQARAAGKGFEFPPSIVVLKHLGSVGSRHSCFQRRGRSHPRELHRSNRTQAPLGVEGRPLAQMRWVGKRLPDFLRRVAQLSGQNERPLFSVLSYLRRAGRTRCVLLAIAHLLLLTSAWIIRSPSALPALQLRHLNEVAAGVLDHGDYRGRHVRWWHGELGAAPP